MPQAICSAVFTSTQTNTQCCQTQASPRPTQPPSNTKQQTFDAAIVKTFVAAQQQTICSAVFASRNATHSTARHSLLRDPHSRQATPSNRPRCSIRQDFRHGPAARSHVPSRPRVHTIQHSTQPPVTAFSETHTAGRRQQPISRPSTRPSSRPLPQPIGGLTAQPSCLHVTETVLSAIFASHNAIHICQALFWTQFSVQQQTFGASFVKTFVAAQ